MPTSPLIYMHNLPTPEKIPPPGRVKGAWKNNVLYMEGDAVCINNVWYVAKKTHTSYYDKEETNPHKINKPPSSVWDVSPWVNITEEVTQPDYKYQRVHSVDSDTVDNFILGKGVPAWYYLDMLGYSGNRTRIRHILELLVTMRGTILGLKTWLNLINIDAEVNRLTPEEYYFIGDSEIPLTFEKWQEEINLRPELKEQAQRAELWKAGNTYSAGDYVTLNKKDPSRYYHTPDNYCACEMYKALQDIQESESEPTANNQWEYVMGYYLKPFDSPYEYSKTPDNSLYRVDVTLLDEDENGGGITAPRDQQRYSCTIQELFQFLVPAWIRLEAGLKITDNRELKQHHASYFNYIADPIYNGIEPYTLTIKPHVGFDLTDPKYVEERKLNHTAAWGVEIYEEGETTPLDVSMTAEEVAVLQKDLDAELLNIEDDNRPKAYAWTETNGDIKVRVLSHQKIRLKPIKKKEINTTFWRWQLLNSYHHVPHFRVTNQLRWRDLEPDKWLVWENKKWKDTENTVNYFACMEDENE